MLLRSPPVWPSERPGAARRDPPGLKPLAKCCPWHDQPADAARHTRPPSPFRLYDRTKLQPPADHAHCRAEGHQQGPDPYERDRRLGADVDDRTGRLERQIEPVDAQQNLLRTWNQVIEMKLFAAAEINRQGGERFTDLEPHTRLDLPNGAGLRNRHGSAYLRR